MVVGVKLFTTVPKAAQRKSLNKCGRVKKVEFRKSMSQLQIKNQIVKTFLTLHLECPTFMKCVNLQMVTVDLKGAIYPSGGMIQSIASKASLYLVESKVNKLISS